MGLRPIAESILESDHLILHACQFLVRFLCNFKEIFLILTEAELLLITHQPLHQFHILLLSLEVFLQRNSLTLHRNGWKLEWRAVLLQPALKLLELPCVEGLVFDW